MKKLFYTLVIFAVFMVMSCSLGGNNKISPEITLDLTSVLAREADPAESVTLTADLYVNKTKVSTQKEDVTESGKAVLYFEELTPGSEVYASITIYSGDSLLFSGQTETVVISTGITTASCRLTKHSHTWDMENGKVLSEPTLNSFGKTHVACSDTLCSKETDLPVPMSLEKVGEYKTISNSDFLTDDRKAFIKKFICLYDSLKTEENLTDAAMAQYLHNGDFVSFGYFPQTRKADDVIIYDDSEDEDIGIDVTMDGDYGETYYLGSDGNWYVMVRENACSEDNGAGVYTDFTTTVNSFDSWSYEYFKVEPIIWRVIKEAFVDATGSSRGNLLLSNSILNSDIPFYGSTTTRSYPLTASYTDSDGKENTSALVYCEVYEYSNLRAYLNAEQNAWLTDSRVPSENRTGYDVAWTNDGFYNNAFTSNQKEKIVTVNVDVVKETAIEHYNTTPGEQNVYDAENAPYLAQYIPQKVFALSEEEVRSTKLGFSANYTGQYTEDNVTYYSEKRIAFPTDYALARGFSSTNPYYLLRSPNSTNNQSRVVSCKNGATAARAIDKSYFGILPAIVVNGQ